MNRHSLARRVDKIEATVAGKRTALRLENGETVYLERLADLRLFFAILRSRHGAKEETGEPVEPPDMERVKLFAQSIPDPNGGQITRIAKEAAQEYLAELEAHNG